jgi:hypothetical protein
VAVTHHPAVGSSRRPFFWMTNVKRYMETLRTDVETLREAVVQLQRFIVEELDPGLVIVSD